MNKLTRLLFIDGTATESASAGYNLTFPLVHHPRMTALNLQTFLNQEKFSRFQWGIFTITFLIAFFDGYDTAVIAYVAKSLQGEWGILKQDLAPVLSAALFGLAVGAISSGPLADKIGRKSVLALSVFIFALGSLLCSQAESLAQLEYLRFFTGIGLGAAMPSAVTLLSEYSPEHQRARIVNTMFCGFPLGAALGGFIAAYLIPEFGWRSTFVFGGVFPVLLSVAVVFFVPESLRFLMMQHKPVEQIRQIIQKINPQAALTERFEFSVSAIQKRGIGLVLSRHYLAGSVLLWICYFMGLVIFYGVMNWMPVLLTAQGGLDQSAANRIVGLFALGGLGSIISGYLMDRYNPNYLTAAQAGITAILIVLMGLSLNWGVALLISVVILSGIVMNTLQVSLPTLAAGFYPAEGRTTGVSWMMGIGRFGGVAGSFLVAELVRRDFSLTQMFYVLAVPALIMMICLLLKQFFYRA